MATCCLCSFQGGSLVCMEIVQRLPALSTDAEEMLFQEYGSKAAFLAPALEVDWAHVVLA
eukprot:5173882-Amphidinium_carterae.1